jgi:radical SAM protein with 4Fe4S-binding SPASM domain
MLEQYLQHLGGEPSLSSKLEKLADIRTKEGYMAVVKDQEDGSLLFIEKHCPICEVAATCAGLCKNELSLFQSVLGNSVHIERVEHILAGGRNCVYKVMEQNN